MQEHELWLRIADDDLKSAKGLLKLEIFSTASYHCQQAAEKSLKAYLAFKNQEILKTHDLMKLVLACSKFNNKFEKLYEAAEELNPFATKFRYPTEFDIPDFKECEDAIKKAQGIMNSDYSPLSVRPEEERSDVSKGFNFFFNK